MGESISWICQLANLVGVPISAKVPIIAKEAILAINSLGCRLAEKLPVLGCLGWANCEKEEQVCCRFSIICQKVAEYHIRLAEAEEKLMGADSESMMKDALIDTLNDRLRAASELIKKWRNETYIIEPMPMTVYDCADELEAALGEVEEMKCELVYLKSGKMWCRTHEQALMYVYSLPRGDLGYRCQVGEDLKSALQTEIIDESIENLPS